MNSIGICTRGVNILAGRFSPTSSRKPAVFSGMIGISMHNAEHVTA
jgi:hypothetical protein